MWTSPTLKLAPTLKFAATLLFIALVQGCVSAKSVPAEEAEPAAPAPVVEAVGDSDGDGVLDDVDECPNTREGVQVDNRGCEIILSISGPLFDFDKSTLTQDAQSKLADAAVVLNENPAKAVQVAGHTDSVGTEEYNLGLGQRRADAVRSYLVQLGVDAARMTTQSYGESEPVASNDTSEGRSQNRRVEIVDLTR